MRGVRATIALGSLICLALALLSAPTPLRAQSGPSKSVFQIVLMTHEGQKYSSMSTGTAFFISSDGTALTAGHVVARAVTDPGTYQLLAIVGREFYSATPVCTSPLPREYMEAVQSDKSVTPRRDVAEIRLKPPQFPFDSLEYKGVPYFTAHYGVLPSFPVIPLVTELGIGDPVRVLGFGRQSNVSVPYEWSAEGTVARMDTAEDGTPLAFIAFSRGAEHGHSGSPVLNGQDQVVGMLDWVSGDNSRGIAIAGTELLQACSSPK